MAACPLDDVSHGRSGLGHLLTPCWHQRVAGAFLESRNRRSTDGRLNKVWASSATPPRPRRDDRSGSRTAGRLYGLGLCRDLLRPAVERRGSTRSRAVCMRYCGDIDTSPPFLEGDWLCVRVLFRSQLGGGCHCRPRNVRNWQPDVSETGWAEVAGDQVTIHNVRNTIYRSETDYTPRWETRVVDLRSIRGADIFITYWGSPWIAHPIISFRYGNNEYLAFSIEVRKEVGEGYSAIRGFFRQFELIYIVSDERDVVRLRTNYRQGEDVYAFRLRASPEGARALFLAIRSISEPVA